MARALTGIVNDGVMVEPVIRKGEVGRKINISGIDHYFYQVVKEGMREAALTGTAKALNIGGFTIAGKTGTAEIGTVKGRVNSWVEGFFPYENPRYAFVLVLENGPNAYKIGSPATMANLLLWMREHKKEYLKSE
jgi:cell division protein FtsI/penicillin-binding protein 2